MRISDWSSDVCSSDLVHRRYEANFLVAPSPKRQFEQSAQAFSHWDFGIDGIGENEGPFVFGIAGQVIDMVIEKGTGRKACYSKHEHDFSSIGRGHATIARSEEHTSELQSLMRNSYAVFCLKKKKTTLQYKYH